MFVAIYALLKIDSPPHITETRHVMLPVCPRWLSWRRIRAQPIRLLGVLVTVTVGCSLFIGLRIHENTFSVTEAQQRHLKKGHVKM